jgi:hypothetical protein
VWTTQYGNASIVFLAKLPQAFGNSLVIANCHWAPASNSFLTQQSGIWSALFIVLQRTSFLTMDQAEIATKEGLKFEIPVINANGRRVSLPDVSRHSSKDMQQEIAD